MKLFPGDKGDKIKVSIEVVDLAEQHPPYEAVSYTWSTDHDQQEIVLNNQRHIIRRNLYDCLRQLRSPSSPRLLWIDFLSISQNELREKSQQVQMIGHVFLEARCVLAWVGEHADGSESLFRDMPPIGTVWTSWPLRLANGRKLRELRKRAAVWTAFFARRYFSRLWVVQEIGNAQAIRVHCGNDSMDWTDLISHHMGSLDDHQWFFEFDDVQKTVSHSEIYPATILRDRWDHVRALDDLWNRERLLDLPIQHEPQPFHAMMGLIELFASLGCSVPQDRIYALRSMEVKLPGEKDIPVDYEMSVSDVFVLLYRYRVVDSPRANKFNKLWVPRGIRALNMSRAECQATLETIQEIIDNETNDANQYRWEWVATMLQSCLSSNTIGTP